MKYTTLAVLFSAVMAAGCATAHKTYQTTVTVSPAGQQQYTVGMTIQATGQDGKQDVLSAPRITVQAGQEGEISVEDEKEENGVFCTALVNETAKGIEALTTIIVKEDGKTMFNTTQKTVMKK